MKRSTTSDLEKKVPMAIKPDVLVPCSWHREKELLLSRYEDMVTHYIQKKLKDKLDANPLHVKEPPHR